MNIINTDHPNIKTTRLNLFEINVIGYYMMAV